MRFTRDGLLTAILVVAALFIGSSISQQIPTADDLFEDPYLHAAARNESVELRTGSVMVTDLATTQQLTYLGSTAATTGVWLVVDLTWRSNDEPADLPLREIRLELADGKRYGGLPVFTPSCGPAQPGLPRSCQVPFELPGTDLDGARLLIPATGLNAGDDVAVVDLNLDDATAARLAAPAEQMDLKGDQPA
ncbi:MAG TPA: hypothetical protein K8V15_11930 [Tessaracoccus flavescens]|uniref:DUF4352 domain-containing protein n=1 Tax=Tessaracoccus flavescens TaxID=399497 RepID=A0A921ESI9_9ACTN|nr:hypothetical protein [Tessaracoccus flavescens]